MTILLVELPILLFRETFQDLVRCSEVLQYGLPVAQHTLVRVYSYSLGNLVPAPRLLDTSCFQILQG